jgi:hypothetical protein
MRLIGTPLPGRAGLSGSISTPWTKLLGEQRARRYRNFNYLIDLKAAIIVDVEATRAIRQAEVGAARTRKKIEMLFAHLKRILRLDRLRLRGPSGARDEFLLAATVQNLRKLAKLILPPALKPA